MPRQARIDIPGALHHIVCGGIERRRIFQDDGDRDDSVGRLGSEFVESVLEEVHETIERRQWLKAQGYDFQKLVSRAGELTSMDVEEVMKPGKQPQRVKARSLVCYWAVLELGLTGASVAKMLGMSQPAVSKAVQRGGNLAVDTGYSLSGGRKL